MTTHLNVTAGERTWQEVIALLYAAKDRGDAEGLTNPAVRATVLGARLTAMAAVALLSPAGLSYLDDVRLAETTTTLALLDLLRAAEEATRRHPIEQYPRGASRIIIDIHALIREVTP